MIGPGRRPPLPPRWSTWAIVLLLSVEARARPTGWRILVEGPPSAGGFIAAAELELRSFGVELARHRVPGQAQDRETIDRLLGEQRAVGLIRVDRRTRAASVWIRQGSVGLARQVVPIGPGAALSAALRTAELVRAHLIARPTPGGRRPAPVAAPRPPPRAAIRGGAPHVHRFGVEVLTTVTLAPDSGLSAAGHLWVMGIWRPRRWLAITAGGAIPIVPAVTSVEASSAALRVGLIGAEARLEARPGHERLALLVGGGASLGLIHATGETSRPLATERLLRATLVAHLRLGAALRLTRRLPLSLRLDMLASTMLWRPAIGLEGRQVGTWGSILLRAGAGLELAFR